MKDDILFSERQKFNQWWFRLFILGINAVVFSGIIQQLIKTNSSGGNASGIGAFLFTAAIMLGIDLLFMSFRLDTIIKKEGIYVRFFPISTGFKFYSWDKITNAYIRTYKPLSEYGGWGIRYGFRGNGRALNVSGNQGLQLEFEDKSKLLIGTKQPGEIQKLLVQIGQPKPA